MTDKCDKKFVLGHKYSLHIVNGFSGCTMWVVYNSVYITVHEFPWMLMKCQLGWKLWPDFEIEMSLINGKLNKYVVLFRLISRGIDEW